MTDLYKIHIDGAMFHATDKPDQHEAMLERLRKNGHEADDGERGAA